MRGLWRALALLQALGMVVEVAHTGDVGWRPATAAPVLEDGTPAAQVGDAVRQEQGHLRLGRIAQENVPVHGDGGLLSEAAHGGRCGRDGRRRRVGFVPCRRFGGGWLRRNGAFFY